MKVSVVMPVYNEGVSVRNAYGETVAMFASQMPQHEYELIFVDDGSHDDTYAHLVEIAARDVQVVVIKLARNCGSHTAVRAGFEYASGDVGCYLPCDLQEPPDLIPRLLEALIDPVKIVWAVRSGRPESFSDRLASRIFFSLGRLMVSENIAPMGAGMFLLGKEAMRALPLYRERNLTLDGLLYTMGYVQAHVPYERKPRVHGRSKWTLSKRLKMFADFFVGYSYAPIRLMSYLGITVAAVGFLYGLFVMVNRCFLAQPIAGWTSLMLVLLLIGGLQMVMMGVMGEYVWRALDEARGRPLYIVEKLHLSGATATASPEHSTRAADGSE
jgi:dolichol-phosphate mannosyltransferase